MRARIARCAHRLRNPDIRCESVSCQSTRSSMDVCDAQARRSRRAARDYPHAASKHSSSESRDCRNRALWCAWSMRDPVRLFASTICSVQTVQAVTMLSRNRAYTQREPAHDRTVSARHLLACADAERLHLAIEMGAVEPKRLSRAAHVAVALVHLLQDEVALVGFRASCSELKSRRVCLESRCTSMGRCLRSMRVTCGFRMTSRSTRLRSSRTLPGQWILLQQAQCLFADLDARAAVFAAELAQNSRTRIGMSSRRSRNGGT